MLSLLLPRSYSSLREEWSRTLSYLPLKNQRDYCTLPRDLLLWLDMFDDHASDQSRRLNFAYDVCCLYLLSVDLTCHYTPRGRTSSRPAKLAKKSRVSRTLRILL